MSDIIKNAPTADQVLTASLKLIIDEFVNMGYDEKIIFGKVNLILNDFITPEGGFTEEYVKMAEQAIKMRASKEFEQALMAPEEPKNTGGLILKVPGGGIMGKPL